MWWGRALMFVSLCACSSSYGEDKGATTDSAKIDRDATESAPPPPAAPPLTSHNPPADADGGAGKSGKTCPADRPGPSPWKPPPAFTNACSTSDVAFFVKQWAATTTWAALKTAMEARPKCSSCIFGSENDINWRVIVLAADGSGDGKFNWGACAARAPNGGGEACGRAFQNSEDCLGTVCAECADTTKQEACVADAKIGTCKVDFDGAHSACNGTFDDIANTRCAYVEDVVRSLCGG
jgi:hypothetical protein